MSPSHFPPTNTHAVANSTRHPAQLTPNHQLDISQARKASYNTEDLLLWPLADTVELPGGLPHADGEYRSEGPIGRRLFAKAVNEKHSDLKADASRRCGGRILIQKAELIASSHLKRAKSVRRLLGVGLGPASGEKG